MPPEYRFKGTARQLDGYPRRISIGFSDRAQSRALEHPGEMRSDHKSSWTSWNSWVNQRMGFWHILAVFRKGVVFLSFYHPLPSFILQYWPAPGDVHLKDCAQLFVKLLASERAQVMHWGAVMRHRMAEPLKPLPAVTAAEFKNYSVHYAVPSSLLAGV